MDTANDTPGLFTRDLRFPNETYPTKIMETLQTSTYRLSLDFNALVSPARNHDDSTIGRPQNAWILFRKNFATRVRKEHQNLAIGEVSKRASNEWKKAPPKVKRLFGALAEVAKKRHKLIHPGSIYKGQPSSKKPGRPLKIIDESDAVAAKANRSRTPSTTHVGSSVSMDVLHSINSGSEASAHSSDTNIGHAEMAPGFDPIHGMATPEGACNEQFIGDNLLYRPSIWITQRNELNGALSPSLIVPEQAFNNQNCSAAPHLGDIVELPCGGLLDLELATFHSTSIVTNDAAAPNIGDLFRQPGGYDNSAAPAASQSTTSAAYSHVRSML